jgi:hypothetical protein
MKVIKNIEKLMDMDRWETWVYGVILPVGFILAIVIGSSIGTFF